MKLACAISSTASSATVLCRRGRRLLSSSSVAKALNSSSYWRGWMSNTIATGSLYQISCSMITSASPPASPALLGFQQEEPNPKPQPWLIVGLGNPGKRYAGTRHNVGFEMIDTIADAEGISMASVSFKAQFGKGFIGDVPVMLAKPQTFMNASGESVGAIISYYKIPLKQVLVGCAPGNFSTLVDSEFCPAGKGEDRISVIITKSNSQPADSKFKLTGNFLLVFLTQRWAQRKWDLFCVFVNSNEASTAVPYMLESVHGPSI